MKIGNLLDYGISTNTPKPVIRTIKELSEEQQEMITYVKNGHNVLVDACIGSGKTTAIQTLCNEIKDKKILYLTYNTLLKLDAKNKIKSYNTEVTNYHGFASGCLYAMGVKAGVTDLIQTFNRIKPNVRKYDILLIDEYQDIDLEISELLEYIKECNPNIQIIAVGDMAQKIYDKTSLDVPKFMNKFLGEHIDLKFTQCFRISKAHAEMLGRIWNKDIKGVNAKCKISYLNAGQVESFLANQDVTDILCLGAKAGGMSYVLNNLEFKYPDKFNKHTVYASIRDEDRGNLQMSDRCAIFTTFDSSKGMERKICVVFDFSEDYWNIRVGMPGTKYEILRNIFCVAASRGKEHIIFVTNKKHELLDEKTLSTPVKTNFDYSRPFAISSMYDFKFKEDVEDLFKLIEYTKIEQEDDFVIDVKSNDGLIDLSPCIGHMQEACFFNNFNIDEEIEFAMDNNPSRQPIVIKEDATLEDKILYLVAYETYYNRYITQVKKPIIDDEHLEKIKERLSTVFNADEEVQKDCEIKLSHYRQLKIHGKIDVFKNNKVYELKFVNELKHENFLQCATYMIATRTDKGILWNIRNNEMFEITIPDRKKFLQQMLITITKQYIIMPNIDDVTDKFYLMNSTVENVENNIEKPILKEVETKSYEAVISYIKNMKNGLISLINATNNKAVHIQYQKEINTLDKILKEFKEL